MTDPVDDIQQARDQIERCKAAGERAYDAMYDVHTDAEVRWNAEIAMDAYRDAYGIAERAGLHDDAKAAMDRLMHIKAVARQLRSS